MKKLLAVILAVALLLGMNVTAYAGTISGSESGCEYTVHIPADCSIEFQNTGLQSIGKVSVTSTNWSAFTTNHKAVQVTLAPTRGELKNDYGLRFPYRAGLTDDFGGFHDGEFSCQRDVEMEYFIQVYDWIEAMMGTTYTATLTYNISLIGVPW